MTAFVIPFAQKLEASSAKGLRIDVSHNSADLEQELQSIQGRMNDPANRLFNLPTVCIHYPGLRFRYREVDGEHYVYVEDPANQCLAGYTVFNRLVELKGKADRYLRAPHSRFAPAYQRRGIATAIYQWWLRAGNSLVTGARQSIGAHALWGALASEYATFYVSLQHKRLNYMGPRVDLKTQSALSTRMILLGLAWDFHEFADAADMSILWRESPHRAGTWASLQLNGTR